MNAPTAQFHLIDADGNATFWDAAEALGRIHAKARALATQVAAGSAVGILLRSGAPLIEAWFACLHAGLRPLIVQYPTRKQSRAYWFDSVSNTIATAELAAIVTDATCAERGLPDNVITLLETELPTAPAPDPGALLPDDFTILQLSSGTTGYRKAMAFSAAALRRHADDYNRMLDLQPGRDRIVSWLPLYHDMGYVACFVMPILLGIEVVMMDPVDWVGEPRLLFDAVEKFQGTICYMPNFGFEVMARVPARPMPSMRYWISCSEPVSAATAAKFCAHTGAAPASFAPCYAMAENLFAVSLGAGFATQAIDGAEVVSCGRPIPGVEVKIDEGEIWVRSPTSLANYLGGTDIRDEAGFYPTGDMGALIDDEIYVSGRKQDVLIQAGRKFMLSDIDLKLNAAYPEIRGRAAALAIRDERLGTETPLILIEAADFFERTDMAEIAARMIDLTGMDQMDVAYVPPRFLTKTSSGKINRRKTSADWLAVQEAKHRVAGPRDPVRELREAFGQLDWSRPMKQVLDSLSLEIAAITVQATNVTFKSSMSLSELVAALEERPRITAASETPQSIRIVSLADRRVMNMLSEDALAAIGAELGCEVTFEHVCLPPSSVVMSDLVFHDWFQPRLDQTPFGSVDETFERLRNASIIITDAIAEFSFIYQSVYPVLSHNLERHVDADLLCFRWQTYTKQHHLLPISFVTGVDVPLEHSEVSLRQMSRYLDVPIMRLATLPGFDVFTTAWEWQLPTDEQGDAGQLDFAKDVVAWIKNTPGVRRVPRRPGPAYIMSDPAHFCGVMARQSIVDDVVAEFDSFYVASPHASLPYLRRKIEAANKPYVLTPSFAPEVLERLDRRYDCLITGGSWGRPPKDLPMVAFQTMGDQRTPRARNVKAARDLGKPRAGLNVLPPCPTDWFCCLELGRSSLARLMWQGARNRKPPEVWVKLMQQANREMLAADDYA